MQEVENFENKLQKLQTLLERLNSDEISLQESVDLYKNGVKLVKEARKILEESQLAIKEIGDIDE